MTIPFFLRRNLGKVFDRCVNVLLTIRHIFETLIFNQEFSERNTAKVKQIKIEDFYKGNFKSQKYKIFWNSTIEDKFLAENSKYTVKRNDLEFSGSRGAKRWNEISKVISNLKILSEGDYVIDLGCSTGALVNGTALLFGSKSVGIDINVDKCLDYAKKFGIKNAKFKQFSIEDLFKLKFDKKFKLVFFTYQSHGDIRWLKNRDIQIRFFAWLRENSKYIIMNDPKSKLPMPFGYFKKVKVLNNADFNPNYPLTIYEVV